VVSSEEASDDHAPTSSSQLDEFASIVSQTVAEPRCRLGDGPLGRRFVGGFGRVCGECVKGSQTCIVDACGGGQGG